MTTVGRPINDAEAKGGPMDVELSAETYNDSPVTVMTEDFDRCIWGSDAQEAWATLRDAGPLVWTRPDYVVAASGTAVAEALHDPGVFSSNPNAMYFGSETGAIPLQIDPPHHSRFRKMLDPMFTPKKMAAREPEVAALANRLIDGFIERGSIDFSREFAVPYPSEVFLHLMGLPFDELEQFLHVKEEMIRPSGDDEASRLRSQQQAGGWIFNYINEALEQRKKDNTDDMLGYFSDLENDGRLTRDEILNICVLFIPAGLDTVTDTLECSFAYLANHPDHRQQLVDNPELIPSAVEELLRYESPVPTVSRITMQDTQLDGCPIAKDTRVRVMLAIANHDPDIHSNPETVDFGRETNPHISFGGGVHRCVGSHLARLELRVAMREWHRRIPTYHLKEGTVLRFRPALREIDHLPLEFPPG
jgi:cytochrome P450